MADLPHRRHGNFPQRRLTLLPQVAKCRVQLALKAMSSDTDPDLAFMAEEPCIPTKHMFCEIENGSTGFCNKKSTAVSSSLEQQQKQPDKCVAALLKKIRVHPEAQRILGNSCIPVVSLQRLNFQSVFVPSLQPVVSLIRLPSQTQNELCNNASLNHPQQNGFSQNEAEVLEIREDSHESRPAESFDLSQQETPTSWTEPYCPGSPLSEEPEQDPGFECESSLDQPYILFDSCEWDTEVKTDSETFYLDPDPEQTMVIELDPEPVADLDQSLQLRNDSETTREADVVQMYDTEGQKSDLYSLQEEEDSSIQQPELEPEPEEMKSEDFCAVCLNGGNLLCCDRCPKVYHLACHVPPVIDFPLGEWVCTLCRSDQEPVEAYDYEDIHAHGEVKAPYTLSHQDQRRCERITLLLCCHLLSAPFHEPVSPLARNYYQIIKRPIDLSVIRKKLDKSNTLHYFSTEQFVDDVLLMFKNCATFNYPDSEVAQAGQNLEEFFLSKLKEIFPERTFPSCSQNRTDRAGLRWLSRKRKENYKKKRYVFSGKKYYL